VKLWAPLAKLTVFAVVTIMLTAVLAQTLGSADSGGTTYRARFTDVTGLLPGDDVRIAGVKVGRVGDIRLVDNSVAEVEFTVNDDIPLNTSVLAKVRYRNLVGQRYVALFEGPGGDRLRRNGLIPVTQTSPALDLTELFNGFQPLFNALSPADVNKLSYQIVQVLQGEAGTVASLIGHTAALTSMLAQREAVIGRVITNLNTVLATLDQHDGELTRTITQLQAFVSGLAGDRTAIGAALVSIGDLTSVTAALLRDARPSLAADIDLINRLAGNLNANTETIERTLDTLPGRLDALTSTMSAGGWVSFYVCEMTAPIPVHPRPNPAQCGAPR